MVRDKKKCIHTHVHKDENRYTQCAFKNDNEKVIEKKNKQANMHFNIEENTEKINLIFDLH